jgi:hypothetical protein
MKKISVLLVMTIYILGTSATLASNLTRVSAAKKFSSNATVKAIGMTQKR